MNVRDLIAALEAQDPHARVMIGVMVGDVEMDEAETSLRDYDCLVTEAAGTSERESELVSGDDSKGAYVQINGWWG